MKRIKKYFEKTLNQRYGIIFGLVMGLVIATGISYGVNSITSEGVSYKKSDGTTVSVKQALDDVINKSLTRIEFLEKWLSSDTGSSLEQIKNKNEFDYLADVVSVGDCVAYDAGAWTETKAKPTSHGQFGGYTSGQNKANSVSVCDSRYGSTTLKGWRVFSIDTSIKTVTLIHAGQPECYYHTKGYSSESLTNLNNRTNTYLNSNYADSAHMMNYDEALAITGNTSATDNTLRKTGAGYWLASAYNTSSLWDVNRDGIIGSNDGVSFGVRPVVVLKSKILTTGMGTDKVGQEAWILVKP